MTPLPLPTTPTSYQPVYITVPINSVNGKQIKGPDQTGPQHMFSWRNKKNINTFGLKKCILPRAMLA